MLLPEAWYSRIPIVPVSDPLSRGGSNAPSRNSSYRLFSSYSRLPEQAALIFPFHSCALPSINALNLPAALPTLDYCLRFCKGAGGETQQQPVLSPDAPDLLYWMALLSESLIMTQSVSPFLCSFWSSPLFDLLLAQGTVGSASRVGVYWVCVLETVPSLSSFIKPAPGPLQTAGPVITFFQAAQCGLASSQSAPCLHWVMDSGLEDCQPIKASPGSGEGRVGIKAWRREEIQGCVVNLWVASSKLAACVCVYTRALFTY